MPNPNQSATKSRTTAGVLGDLLASMPAERTTAQEASVRIERHRSGVDKAVAILVKAGAIHTELDASDRRRNVIYMTPAQAKAWTVDGGATYAATGNFSLMVSEFVAKAAAASNAQARERAAAPLRFGVWSDGALAIEGLGRKQLTVPAVDTGALALLFASFPEGALQALCDSPLKPAFSLHIAGKDYPLTAQQTAQLIDYIEQLPSRAIKGPVRAGGFATMPKAGTDNRMHRIETPADREPVES